MAASCPISSPGAGHNQQTTLLRKRASTRQGEHGEAESQGKGVPPLGSLYPTKEQGTEAEGQTALGALPGRAQSIQPLSQGSVWEGAGKSLRFPA